MEEANLGGTIIGILGVSFVTWIVYQLAPMIQSLVDDQFNYSRGESEFKDNQPLYKIFYQFNHKTSKEWLKWILSQSEETKAKAYEKLQNYLENPAKKLGLSARDVIMAVAAFKRKDSFETLLRFLESVKPHIGTLKTIELFYSDILAALIKLDLNKGAIVIKAEVDYFTQKRNTETINYDDYRIKVIKAFALMDTVPKEARDSMVEILCNTSLKANVRKELIKVIADYNITNVIEYVYPRVLKFFLQDENGIEINQETNNTLEFLFYSFKELSKNNEEIWGLIIEACLKEKTQSLYINIITNALSDRAEVFNYQNLAELLAIEDPIKDAFVAALKARNYVTDEEMTVFRPKIKEDELNFEPGTIIIEKSRKTRVIVNKLLDSYKRLSTILEHDFTTANKAERRASHSIKLLTGTGAKEKLYLLRALAANENRSFVYIDIAKMIYNVPELNKLLSTINNAKPAIVYVDNLLQIFNSKLDEAGRGGIKIFFKTLRELAMLPSVTFFGGAEIAGKELQKQPELKQVIHSGIKGNYELSINLDLPSDEEKLAIVTDILSKISSDKIDKFFSPDALLKPMKEKSFLEFWTYICDFFEKALMIRGRILDPDKLFCDLSHDDVDERPAAKSETKIKESLSAA